MQKHQFGMAVSAGVLLCIFAAVMVGNMKTLFGIYIPKEMAVGIAAPLSFGFAVLAYALHRQRKNPETTKVYRVLGYFLAYALFVIGSRLTAAEMLAFSNEGSFPNNGYTVTGGFMMLFSGLLAGYLKGKK